MKKITSLVCILVLSCTFAAMAQKNKKAAKNAKTEGYVFTDVKRLPAMSVKDQNRAGTCWAWSGVSFFESEMIRMGKDSLDLSAMYVVRHAYADKAEKYVRLHGYLNFAVGGAFGDVIAVIRDYGIVPKTVYEGLEYGESNHVFNEIDNVLKGYVDGVIKPYKEHKLTTAWKKGFNAILDAYLGAEPEKFTYKGKEYTPKTFAKEVVGLNMDDYINLTSFTHHPFYTQFAIEVPDNWRWGMAYNLPLDEFMQIMDNAIDNGFTILWGSDVSETGFATRTPGVAVIPTIDKKEMSGAEIAKWEANAKDNMTIDAFKKGPAPEKEITQEMRQQEYDNYKTTDDHGMHIIGKAKDQNGTPYFIVKNSWNKYNNYGGYFYASYPFVAFKTLNYVVHKDAIPAAIKAKLGIK